jgi:hypothetical protein
MEDAKHRALSLAAACLDGGRTRCRGHDDTHPSAQLTGQPEAVEAEVVGINTDARHRALSV